MAPRADRATALWAGVLADLELDAAAPALEQWPVVELAALRGVESVDTPQVLAGQDGDDAVRLTEQVGIEVIV